MRVYRAAVVVGLAVMLVAVVTTAGATPRSERAPTLPPNGTAIAADEKVVEIEVLPDGTAVWRVQYRVKLTDRRSRSRFATIENRVESNPLQFTGPFRESMTQAASVAARDTGRTMTIRNVSVRTRRLPNGYGVVTYRFEWTRFAATPGGRMAVGDAIVGFFLASENSTLLIQWPAGYDPKTITPEPDKRRERAAVWYGPVEFAPDEPRLVLTGGPLLPRVPPGAAVAAVVLVAVGAVGWQRRRTAAAESADPGTEPTAGATPERNAPAETTETSQGKIAGTGGGTPDETEATADEETVPEELLSDEERVVNLLEANGGRMKQQDVVTELDWSETKTSQVVGDLRDEDEIEVYRIGRENVLSLPGEMDV